jgi:hypothetical protein
MRERYPAAADRIIAVLNGCDGAPMPSAPRDRFVIAYAGTIYLDRDPRLLFRATARVAAELGLGPGEIGIEMMGDVASFDGHSVGTLAEAEGAGSLVRVYPRGRREEALAFLGGASLLVSLPQDSHLAIPSKVYEYMQFSAWLLALADERSATARLLHDSGADVIRPGDEDGMARVIRSHYLEHRSGVRPKPLASNPRFSRGRQAERFVAALEARLGAGTPPPERRPRRASRVSL